MRIQLQEGRTIKSAQNAVDLLNSGKLAGRLGGKKFVPTWLQEDEESFRNLVDATLLTIGDDPNIAGDETIQLMIKLSMSGPDRWLAILENLPDLLVALSRAFAAQWFAKSPEWMSRVEQLIQNETFDLEAWHELEKDIQDTFAKRAAKKHKAINDTNTLYDTLYEDKHWKLCVPKSFEGDIELASHMEPFGEDGEYTKARWCTAAQKNYYERYTNNGRNKLYVIQYYSAGKYKGAWQLAFCDPTHIEFMDKDDAPRYSAVRRQAPRELLEKVICDNDACLIKGFSLAKIWDIIGSTRKIDDVFYHITPYYLIQNYPDMFTKSGERVWLTKDGKGVVYVEDDGISENEVLEFPESVERFVGERVYMEISDFATIHVPKGIIDSLNNGERFAFLYDYGKTKTLIFDEGIEKIPDSFAYRTRRLENVILPSTLTKIGLRAFEMCRALTHIELPSGLMDIGDEAFSNTMLSEITLPENLTIIGDGAFKHCSELTSIVIPEKVSGIGVAAFSDCAKLTSVKLPAKLDFKGARMFEDCPELRTVTNMQVLADVDNCFDGCPNLDLSPLEDVRTRIPDSTFQDNNELGVYVVSDKITEIGEKAFCGSSITKVVIGTNVTSIEYGAFMNCTKLKVVDFTKAKNLKSIGGYAFYGTDLEVVNLPSSVETLGKAVFSYCRNLKVAHLGENIRILEKDTFEDCEALTSVSLPSKLRKVRSECFKSCTSLSQIELPRAVSNIGDSAFAGCSSLTSIRLPKRVAFIPRNCFTRCNALESVEFSTNVVEIHDYAFEYCEKLVDVNVYGDMEDFDMYMDIDYSESAFRQCPFEEILIEAGVYKTNY